MMRDVLKDPNTPKAFLDYVRSHPFDKSSLRAWEVETLSALLMLTKDEKAKYMEMNNG